MTTLTLPETVQSNQAGGKILIVDDDQRLGDALMLYLKRTGYNVAIAYDGVQGLEAFQTFRPDLVLLDVLMPDCDGWSVLASLKRDPITAGIPVVILSVVDEKKRALEAGAACVVAKPIDRTALLRALDNALEKSSTKPAIRAA